MKATLLASPTMRSGTMVCMDMVTTLTPAAKKPIIVMTSTTLLRRSDRRDYFSHGRPSRQGRTTNRRRHGVARPLWSLFVLRAAGLPCAEVFFRFAKQRRDLVVVNAESRELLVDVPEVVEARPEKAGAGRQKANLFFA